RVSISAGSIRARSIASCAARTAKSEVYSPGAALRRCLMPVRVVIHSSEVSTIFSRSAFVRMPSGYARPVPSIAALTSPIGLPAFLNFRRRAQGHGLARVRLADSALDARERAVLGELLHVADGVAYGARVRAAVADDDDAANAQKRRAAVLGVEIGRAH